MTYAKYPGYTPEERRVPVQSPIEYSVSLEEEHWMLVAGDWKRDWKLIATTIAYVTIAVGALVARVVEETAYRDRLPPRMTASACERCQPCESSSSRAFEAKRPGTKGDAVHKPRHRPRQQKPTPP